MNRADRIRTSARYLGEAALIQPLRVQVQLLPLDLASRIAGGVGQRLAGLVLDQRTAEFNVATGIPTSGPAEQARIARAHAANFSRAMAECLHLPTLVREAPTRITLHGAENLPPPRSNRVGVVFASAHLGNPEACRVALGALTSRTTPALVYRPPKNPYIVGTAEAVVRTLGAPIFSRVGFLGRALRNHVADGGDIFVLLDQRTQRGELIPFLDVPAITSTGLATLSRNTGAPFVPIFATRRPGRRVEFDVYIEPPIVAGDSIQMMTEFNRRLSERIRTNPEQWLWSHNRWAGTRYAPSPTT